MIKAILMDFGDTVVVEEEGKKLSDMELRPVEGVERFLSQFSRLPVVIISNTIHSDHRDIKRLLDELGLGRFIRKVITSRDFGAAKPDPSIFQAALEFLNLKVDEVIMIGDRLDVDIEGASRAGISSIHLHWRTRHDDKSPEGRIQPTWCAKNYDEVAQILIRRGV